MFWNSKTSSLYVWHYESIICERLIAKKSEGSDCDFHSLGMKIPVCESLATVSTQFHSLHSGVRDDEAYALEVHPEVARFFF